MSVHSHFGDVFIPQTPDPVQISKAFAVEPLFAMKPQCGTIWPRPLKMKLSPTLSALSRLKGKTYGRSVIGSTSTIMGGSRGLSSSRRSATAS